MPANEDMSAWFQPQSGDLLRDVLYLDERLSTEANLEICSIYARSVIVSRTLLGMANCTEVRYISMEFARPL